MLNGSDTFGSKCDYLSLSLSNPALFTALDIRSTMLSRGRISVIDLNTEKEIPKDDFLKVISNPNPFQSQNDFVRQHEWFKSLGTNVVRIIKIRDSGKANDIKNVRYLNNLIPSCINWKDVNKLNQMVISERDFNQLQERVIEYTVGDKKYPIKISDLEFFYDVSNGMVNDSVFKSTSRIDALLPSLHNISEAQKAKNINLQFSSKFVATNKAQEMNTRQPLEVDEKNEIERAIFSSGIMATNADVDIKSLANDMRKLMYDESTAADAAKVFGTYGISKEVLSWFADGSSTYDNADAGMIDFIQNTIQFSADDFCNTWSNAFNYLEQGKKIVMTFDHLPSMQKVEVNRIEFIKTKAEILKALVDSGASFETAIKMVGFDDLKKGATNV
ncbi:structural protein [Cellulophaga phage phi19:1]|uniref:Structural protein n=1 Tax=Cellulophaga phage phi19:1 TaxID=1327970 RepID=R9ZXW7_9CAUD|nr:structural protein [Cellulophaga phage phi19:1]AGO47375.1 structural protein [Cellulophaga phage phi19:1]